ncbi:kinase-like domain-containing protein [Phascolomyces articulosus]|uniref:non-specific serine/threonine protein kinase n=1 Tax=Phascolomyces articulosus TaxID=60185 RepID=A0AAD5PDF1_9FUNG|nr:kinase-like domain-containing protein [Phascolomyces articulosus]
MSVDKSDSECGDDSSDCSNKFWHRPHHDHSEATINDSSESLGTSAFDGVLAGKPNNKNNNSSKKTNKANNNTNSTASTANHIDDDRGISKRRQTKMLLVSLIESFCRVHGDSPEANRCVFFLICQTLSSLGFIDSEFLDEMSGVRSTFQSAFQTLFITAVETVNNPSFRKPMMIASSSATEDASQQSQQEHSLEQTPFVQGQQRQRQESLQEQPPIFDLNIQNSRYRNDFVQVSLLGRGGFASVWRAHNKLDNIDYAVKQIHLGPDLTDDDRGGDEEQNPYDKIFREIKHLARLEHKNVVRYYSSWLEYTSHAPENDHAKLSNYNHNHRHHHKMGEEESDNDSIFGGQDPTFDDHDEELTFSSAKLSEEDMSRIDFVNADDDVDDKKGKNIVTTTNNDSKNGTISFSPPPSSNNINNNHPSSSKMNCLPKESANSNKDTAVCIPNIDSKRSTRKERERRKSIKKRTRAKSRPRCGWTLYIQMYLCPATLYDYIKHRNDTGVSVDKVRNIELFTQILEGAAYIHSSGLIHRDLKPSNIFLTMTTTNEYHHMNNNGSRRHWRSSSSNHSRLHHQHSFSYDSVRNADGTLRDCMWNETWIPKLGDFGLAAAVMTTHCKEAPPSLLSTSSPMTDHLSSFMDHHHRGSQHSLMSLSSSYCRRGSDDSSSSSSSSSGEEEEEVVGEGNGPCVMHKLTSAVGTRTYAAPEQLADPPRPYDDKADIYSLGIIFFELYQPFRTVMERACAIERLKKGVFPDGFVEMYPKESALILWMMDEEPAHRPSAEQLLEFELFVPQSAAEEGMYSNLQAQLQAKSVALDTKDKEMAALRDKMEQIEQQNKKDMEVMQKRVDELQRQLSLVQLGHMECTPSPTTTSSSNSSNSGLSKILGHHHTPCK